MPVAVAHTLDDPAAASQFIEVNLLVSDEIATLRSMVPRMLSTYSLLNDVHNLGCPYYYTGREQDTAAEDYDELRAELKELNSTLDRLRRLLRTLRSVTRPKTEAALKRHYLLIDSFLNRLLKISRDLIHAPNFSLAEEIFGHLHTLLNTTKYGL